MLPKETAVKMLGVIANGLRRRGPKALLVSMANSKLEALEQLQTRHFDDDFRRNISQLIFSLSKWVPCASPQRCAERHDLSSSLLGPSTTRATSLPRID